jgi:hypothetical protein
MSARTCKGPRSVRYYRLTPTRHLRLARRKLHAVIVLLYRSIVAAFSPELVAQGEAWAQDLWREVKRALPLSNLTDHGTDKPHGEPRCMLPDDDGNSTSGICICICIRICMCMCMCICTYMYIYSNMYNICTYIYIFTYPFPTRIPKGPPCNDLNFFPLSNNIVNLKKKNSS